MTSPRSEDGAKLAGRVSAGRRVRLAVGLLAIAGGLIWLAVRDTPASLLASARKMAVENPDAAERLTEEAVVRAGGSFPEAEAIRSLLFAKLGRWPEALGTFSQIERFDQCAADELIELAEAALASRQPTLARLAAGAARRHPHVRGDGGRLARLLLVERVVGDETDLIDDCETLRRVAPDDWRWGRTLAEVEMRRGRLAAAADALRNALERSPPEAERTALRQDLVDRLLDVGDVSGARTEVDALARGGQILRETLLRQAMVSRLEGNLPAAETAVDEALRVSPGWSPARLVRGILRLDAGQAAEALADLESVVRQEPFRKEAHHKLGTALVRIGEEERGRGHLDRARQLTRWTTEILDLQSKVANGAPDPDVLSRLAELNRRIGRFDEADRWKRLAEAHRRGK